MDDNTPSRLALSEVGHLSEVSANRYLYEESGPEERKIIEAHLAECGQCRDFLDTLRTYDDAWASTHTWRGVETESGSPEPERSRAHRDNKVIDLAARRRTRRMAAIATTLAAAAAVALVVWTQMPDNTTPDNLGEYGQTQTKGSGFGLAVYRNTQQGAERLSSGQEVHPGDKIGFQLYTEEPGYLLITGSDDQGNTYLCYPQNTEKQAILVPAGMDGVVLEAAMELDELLGREHIVGFMCPKPFGFEDIESGLKKVGDEPLPLLLEGCAQREIVLKKVGSTGGP